MKKVITMGELLIDFIPVQKGVSLQAVQSFQKMAGGAPANVAVTVARLGGDSAFLGQVGKDAFGDFLIAEMVKANVDVSGLTQTASANTALAFVTLTEAGERDFVFYRNPSADQLFEEGQIKEDLLQNAIFHFCSVSLSDYPVQKAHRKAIQMVKNNGGFVSFDPNLRLALWSDHAKYKQVIRNFIPKANLLKISIDELHFITGIENPVAAISSLFLGDVEMIVLTKGKDGAEFYTKHKRYFVPGYQVDVVDTTGAGDAFIGALLFQLSQQLITPENGDKLIPQFIQFANACAALTTTKFGAMNALPTLDEINCLMSASLVK